jgi:hypothetical protein
MSTPDRTPEQPEPDTRQGPQNQLVNEGWGTTAPGNPFTEGARTVPWFRRPGTLIGSATVAVVVIVGLVIALVVTMNDGSTETATPTTAPAVTTTVAPSQVNSDYTAETDAMFLGTVNPVLRLYASDDDLFIAGAAVCMIPTFGTSETGKLAIITTAQQIAKWKGLDIPTTEGSSVSMPQSLADDAAELVVAAEAAYCPGEVNDGSSDLL